MGATWNLQHTTSNPGKLVDSKLPESSIGTPEVCNAGKVTVGPAPRNGDGGVDEPGKAVAAPGSSMNAVEELKLLGESSAEARGAVMGGFLGTDTDRRVSPDR